MMTHCVLQVIQQDSFQQQPQQQQQQQQQQQPHTIPINIIAPVNVQQAPPPPPPPPPPATQPTQIQIILPQSPYPAQPLALNPGAQQRQIILQVQDPAPPPPPPPAAPPPPVETPVQAVMQGGRVVSLPPSVLQSILEQLQGGGE